MRYRRAKTVKKNISLKTSIAKVRFTKNAKAMLIAIIKRTALSI